MIMETQNHVTETYKKIFLDMKKIGLLRGNRRFLVNVTMIFCFILFCFLFIPIECKVLRVDWQFVAKFTVINSNSRVMSNCIRNISEEFEECVRNCIREEKCQTFNYHEREQICELLNISKFDGPGLMRRHLHWVHYETDDDAENVGPVCEAISPCKKYQVCEDTFQTHPAYICRCRDGFEGEKCLDYKGPGTTEENPAASCPLLLQKYKTVPDGLYWFQGRTAKKYCGRKVNGRYTAWSAFSPCSVTYGTGERIRHRNCTNPQPKNNGRDCSQLGPSKEAKTCDACPPTKLITSERDIAAGQLVAAAEFMGLEYAIELEVMEISLETGDFLNILEITNDQVGRIPRIYIRRIDGGNRVVVDVSDAGGHLERFQSTSVFPIHGNWMKLLISQKRDNEEYNLVLHVDGKEEINAVNNRPHEFRNVKIYARQRVDALWTGKVRNLSVKGLCNVVNKL